MIRLVVIASLLVGCRISLEDSSMGDDTMGRRCKVDTTSQICMDATSHSDLAWIEGKIFVASCAFSGCHNGASTPEGMVDLRAGRSYAHLVNFTSLIESSRKLVVPNDINASYLMLMLGDVSADMASPPGTVPSVGLMPLGNLPLCCQKLDALQRWIMAGAPNN